MKNRREFMRVTAGAAAGVAAVGAISEAEAHAAKVAHAHAAAYAVAPVVSSLPIIGSSQRFPVRRIYCMGLNYPAHAAEKASEFSAPPFYFQKSADMIVQNNSTISYPIDTQQYQHEIEMVVALKSGGVNIAKENALDCVFGYATGLDMTRRDRQSEALHHGMPWEPGKSFDQCAPCTAISPVSKVGHIAQGRIQVAVNGKTRQDDDIKSMTLDVAGIISLISKSVALAAGDIIYTGTPAGSDSVVSGDKMVGSIDGLDTLTITVA